MKTVAVVAAACASLVWLAGCGGAVSPDAAREGSSATVERARAGLPAPRSGEPTPLGDGLSIAVSQPVSFVPTGNASPAAERAVGFEMTVRNEGVVAYRPTLLALIASAGDEATRQVIDSTQGYSGVVGAAEIAPGRSMRFSVAFAVPPVKTEVRVHARPDPGRPTVVTVFDGVA